MYLVAMYRQDYDINDPLIIDEFDDNKKAFELLKALEKEWIESAKEERPFRLTKPHKEIFISSLIIKVSIVEMDMKEYEAYKDPMHNQMQKEGFTETMSKWGWNSN